MAILIDRKQTVSFEALFMSQIVQTEALTRLLVENGVFTKEEFLEKVKVVDQEMKRQRKGRLRKRGDVTRVDGAIYASIRSSREC